MKEISKHQVVFEEMKKAFSKFNLPIAGESHDGGLNVSGGLFHPEGPYKEIILAGYAPDIQFINIDSMLVSMPIQENKIPGTLEILNVINILLPGVTLRFRPDIKAVDLRAGMFVPNHRFDAEEFAKLMECVMDIGHRYYPLILDFLAEKIDKSEALQRVNRMESETE